jgi:hypothetical protein
MCWTSLGQKIKTVENTVAGNAQLHVQGAQRRSILGSIRRAPWEFAGIAPGNRIELLYADHWPQTSLPQIGFRNSTLLAFMGLLSLALSVHLVLFLMKYRAWRRRIMSVSQSTHE